MAEKFVAINYISCTPEYVNRFEELFASRAHAIDSMKGFIKMHVLKPSKQGENYLIVSYWENEESFKNWTVSKEFIDGHKRGFEDIRKAKELGLEPPMKSDFKVYEIISH
jgi:heme-degrading monooxygenase HmoA